LSWQVDECKPLAAGRVCVLDIDVQGAEIVKRSNLDAVYVFVAPPSMEELERRLRGRGLHSFRFHLNLSSGVPPCNPT